MQKDRSSKSKKSSVSANPGGVSESIGFNISGASVSKKYYITTYGCQMNYSDSERFSNILEGEGFERAGSWEESDLLVINSCSVRQKSEDKVSGFGKKIAKHKLEKPDMKVILTGCMARRRWEDSLDKKQGSQLPKRMRQKQLLTQLAWVDHVVETKDFAQQLKNLEYSNYLNFTPNYQNNFQAYVPISIGCNHFCSYCIVPFARGKEKCRPASTIITEVFNLVRDWYKDITLLGQTVNRWVDPAAGAKEIYANQPEKSTVLPEINNSPLNEQQLKKWQEYFDKALSMESELRQKDLKKAMKELPPVKDFLNLLQVIDMIQGNWWFSWVSSHPNYMTDKLIEFISDSTKDGHQRPYIHFALQSGSDGVLKRMNRGHNYQEFSQIVSKLRQGVPSLGLTTDIIVGFPGETESDFQKTVAAMKECKFDMAYVASFSPRGGTAAAKMKDDVSAEEKIRRKRYLNDEVLAKVSGQFNQRLVGTKQIVLVDGVDKFSGDLSGKTAMNNTVRILGERDQSLVGKFVETKITNATAWALSGEIGNVLD